MVWHIIQTDIFLIAQYSATRKISARIYVNPSNKLSVFYHMAGACSRCSALWLANFREGFSSNTHGQYGLLLMPRKEKIGRNLIQNIAVWTKLQQLQKWVTIYTLRINIKFYHSDELEFQGDNEIMSLNYRTSYRTKRRNWSFFLRDQKLKTQQKN